jgi:MFS family permease
MAAMGEPRIYHGWRIVAGLFVVLTVSSGFGFYNMSVYMSVLAATRGFAVGEAAVAVSIFFVVGGVAGMIVARLLERFDVRWIMVAGAVLAGAALGASGSVESLGMVYVLFGLFGLGNAAVSVITATTLVTRWFPGRNRSVALSVASTGLSAGGILLTPASARVINAIGLDDAMPWIGAAFVLVIVPLVLGVLRDRPRSGAPGYHPAPADETDWHYRDAIRSRFFVLLTLGYLLAMGAQVGGISHLYHRAEVVGDFRSAATAVQILTFFSISGRFVGGWLVTRIPIRRYTLGNLVGQALGLSVIATATGTDAVLVGAAIFGSTVGNLLMLHPLWLAEGFGVRAYPRIFSLSNALTVIGVASGPTLLGVVFDEAGYSAAYLTATGASLLALCAVTAAGAAPVRAPESLAVQAERLGGGHLNRQSGA